MAVKAIIFLLVAIFKLSFGAENCDITIDITNQIRIGDNYVYGDSKFTPDDYFVNSSGVFGCLCNIQNCARDCCDKGQTLDILSGKLRCVQATNQRYTNLKGAQLHHIIQVPDRQICTEDTQKIILNASEYDLELKEHGYLQWESLSWHYKEYCISAVDDDVVIIACVQADNGFSGIVYSIGMIISMPFLLITFVVYAILPDRNLHQRALMFYVLSLLISYILLVTINLSQNLQNPWCGIFGYSTLFFFMVSFFWMNVICFDIWYTFSGGRGFVGSKRSSETKRLILYGVFAFGVPVLIVLIVFLMQNNLPEDSAHNPGIGIEKCFLKDGWPNLWYFYGEAGILVIINIVFFLLTAFKIRQVKKETSMLKHNDSKRHTYEKDKQKFNLYLKLLFAMGVNWSMEVISWLVNWQTNNNIQYIWYATDFFNAVYGVFIFFIFVFKKKIWTLLRRRYYNFIGRPHLGHTITSTNTRTSHYSTANTSTVDTAITDPSQTNGRARSSEEMALRRIT